MGNSEADEMFRCSSCRARCNSRNLDCEASSRLQNRRIGFHGSSCTARTGRRLEPTSDCGFEDPMMDVAASPGCVVASQAYMLLMVY